MNTLARELRNFKVWISALLLAAIVLMVGITIASARSVQSRAKTTQEQFDAFRRKVDSWQMAETELLQIDLKDAADPHVKEAIAILRAQVSQDQQDANSSARRLPDKR